MANTCRQLKMNTSTSRPVMSSGCLEPKLHTYSESFDSADIENFGIFGILLSTINIQDHLVRYKTHKGLLPSDEKATLYLRRLQGVPVEPEMPSS